MASITTGSRPDEIGKTPLGNDIFFFCTLYGPTAEKLTVQEIMVSGVTAGNKTMWSIVSTL